MANFTKSQPIANFVAPDVFIGGTTNTNASNPGGSDGINNSKVSTSSYNALTDLKGISVYGQDVAGNQVKWGGAVGSSVTLGFSFYKTANGSKITYSDVGAASSLFDFNANQISTTRDVLAFLQNVTNIKFNEVTESSTQAGDLRFMNSTSAAITTARVADFPGGNISSSNAADGDVWIGGSKTGLFNSDYVNPTTKGTYGNITYWHEIGHALGLAHPHHSTVATDVLHDQMKYSIMSYKSYAGQSELQGYDQDYYATTYMLNDFEALQALYGANTTFNDTRGADGKAGSDGNINDTYRWDANQKIFETIYDAGGVDTIDATNQTVAVKIDLQPGTFSNIGPKITTGTLSNNDFLAMSYEAKAVNGSVIVDTSGLAINLIENALGSTLNDTLIGNQGHNELIGNLGNDSMVGGAGNDSLGGGGTVTADRVNGVDTMVGGTGNDSYWIFDSGDLIVENSNEGTDQVYSYLYSYTMASNVENMSLYNSATNGIGNASNNTIFGNEKNNYLDGGDGNDLVRGGLGADSVYGGSGNDDVFGDDGNDNVGGGHGNDYIYGGAGDDTIECVTGAGFTDEVYGGAGLDRFEFYHLGFAKLLDFSSVDDQIQFLGSTYGLSAGTVIQSANFISGSGFVAAKDSNDFIIHDASTGKLFFDRDGSNTTYQAINFCQLNVGTAVNASDFQII